MAVLSTPGREGLVDTYPQGKLDVDEWGELILADEALTVPTQEDYVAKCMDPDHPAGLDLIAINVLAADEEAFIGWQEAELEMLGHPVHGFRHFLENWAGHSGASGKGWEQMDLWDFQWGIADVLVNEPESIWLKTRRAGFTLIVCHYMVWLTVFCKATPSATCVAVSKTGDDAKKLIETCRAIITHLDPAIRPQIGSAARTEDGKPAKDQAGGFVIAKDALGRKRGSEIISKTTGKRGPRGLTARFLFLDEFAHFPDGVAGEYWTAAEPVTEGGGQICVGSTGNGTVGDGEQFAILWQAAVDRVSDMVAGFIAWWMRPTRLKRSRVEEVTAAFSAGTGYYASDAGEQIRKTICEEDWFQKKLGKNPGNEEKVRQEYPTTWREGLAGKLSDILLEPEHLDAVIEWGQELDDYYEETGSIRGRVDRGVNSGNDWRKYSASVVGLNLEGDSCLVTDELLNVRIDPSEHSGQVLSKMLEWGEPESTYQDGSADGDSIPAFEKVFWAYSPYIVVEPVNFSTEKRKMLAQLKRMLANTAKGRSWQRLGISPTRAPQLIAQLRGAMSDSRGMPVKINDHLLDALLCLMKPYQERWEFEYGDDAD